MLDLDDGIDNTIFKSEDDPRQSEVAKVLKD